MSLNSLQKFLFEEEREPQENDFTIRDVLWTKLQDSNMFNYNVGWINFNNSSLHGNDLSRMLELSNSMLTVPFGCIVSVSGDTGVCSFGTISGVNYVHSAENVFAVAPKAYHHILNQISNSFGGKLINQPTEYFNYYLNEKMKRMNNDQYVGSLAEMMNYDLDTSKSYSYNATVLETNNSTTFNSNLSLGNNSSNYRNDAHIRRMKKLNYDWVSNDPTNNKRFYQATILNDTYATGLISVNDEDGNPIPADTLSSTKPIKYLVFQYCATIPLMYVSEFYEKLDSLTVISSLELKIQTNLAQSNSWSVTYNGFGNTTNAPYTLASTTSNQSIGQTCPFLISPAGRGDAGTGMQVYSASGTVKPTITVKPFIGYATGTTGGVYLNNGYLRNAPNTYPCQIWIPSVAYNKSYMEKIISTPKKKLLYNDFMIDATHTNVAPGNQISRLLIHQSGNYRKLYILPFLAVPPDLNTACDVRQSLVSSAPTTVSACKLINLQVMLGSVNVFSDIQSFNINHFYNGVNISQGGENGNAFKSLYQSGKISYNDWINCYNVYVVDLERVSDEITDNTVRNINLTYKIDSATAVYNMVYVIEYQSGCFVDRLTGQVVGSDST